jgi:predicted DNA-binding transcriptional regulator YafY
MSDRGKQKLKLLYLAKMFRELTDDENGLTMAEILQLLSSVDITAERKGIYRDIETLRMFGMDIRKYQRAPVEYGLVNRDFSVAEVTLIIDALQSSRFLSEAAAGHLVESVRGLVSRPQGAELRKRVHVHGRTSSQENSQFGSVDVIQRAIAETRWLQFSYFKLDADMNKVEQHGGEPYLVIPVDVVYSDGNYYLVAYHESYDSFANYRIDRMQRIIVRDQQFEPNETVKAYDAAAWCGHAFGMFSGREESVTLRVREEAMSAVADKLGADMVAVRAQDAPGEALVSVCVAVSPPFFGWLAGFGSAVVVEKPASVRDEYAAWLRDILAGY